LARRLHPESRAVTRHSSLPLAPGGLAFCNADSRGRLKAKLPTLQTGSILHPIGLDFIGSSELPRMPHNFIKHFAPGVHMNDDIIKVISPIYLLRSFQTCWKCRANQAVIAIATRHLEESDPDALHEGDEPVVLENIEMMPASILQYILRVHPHYEKRPSKMAGSAYYMNTCSCGAHFGDFFLHNEPGGAFFPTSEDEASQIEIEVLHFTGKFDFVCSYGVGTGDFIFAHARKR